MGKSLYLRLQINKELNQKYQDGEITYERYSQLYETITQREIDEANRRASKRRGYKYAQMQKYYASKPQQITQVQDDKGKVFTGQVVNETALNQGKATFIGVREVTPQEQKQREIARNAQDLQFRAQYNLRKQELKNQSYAEFKERAQAARLPPSQRPSQDQYTQKYGTETQRRDLFSKRFIQTTPEQRYIRAATGQNVEYQIIKRVEPQYDDGTILVERGYGERLQRLAKREKNLEETKQAIYARGGIFTPGGMSSEYYDSVSIQAREGDDFFTKNLKAINRAPYEIAFGNVLIGGRVGAYAETVFKEPQLISLTEKDVREKTAKGFLYTFDVKNNPDAYVNIGLTALAIKAEQKSPPGFIKSTYEKYVPLEDLEVKFINAASEDFSFKDFAKLQGKTVRTTHTTYEDIWKKPFVEMVKSTGKASTFEVKAFPEKASGFRRAIGEYGFYQLTPEKATGKTLASGYYVGLGSYEAQAPRVSFTLGEPTRYLNIFEGERVAQFSPAEKAGITARGQGRAAQVSYGRLIVQEQTRLGGLRIAPENIVGQSSEGQVIKPVGEISELTGRARTTYRPANPYNNPFAKGLYEIFNKGYEFRVRTGRISSQAETPEFYNNQFFNRGVWGVEDITTETSAFNDFAFNNRASSPPTKQIGLYIPPVISRGSRSSATNIIYSSGSLLSRGTSATSRSTAVKSKGSSFGSFSSALNSFGFSFTGSKSSVKSPFKSFSSVISSPKSSGSVSKAYKGGSNKSPNSEFPSLFKSSKRKSEKNLFKFEMPDLVKNTAYKPTVFSAFNEIFATKKSKIGEISGLGIRPIIRGF